MTHHRHQSSSRGFRRNVLRTIAGFFVLLPAIGVCAGSNVAKSYLNDPDLRSFIDEMVARHGFDAVKLASLFSRVQPRQDIIEAISHPAEAKPWYQYRPIFVTRSRIQGGVEFWELYEDELNQASEVYGVPPEIVVAIIGVETRYGKYTGRHRVLEALSTLAFDYPPRSRFFRSELEHYLLLTREENIDPLAVTGSYAGAMGGPQFISSSYRRYAVDFDDDGSRDLFNSYADMIGSVANYFAAHGWKRGEPIAVPAQVKGEEYERLRDLGLKPRYDIDRLGQYGVIPKTPVDPERLASLIALETHDGEEFWLGLHNFYVITRYNHSALYAMAVYQLSRRIADARVKGLQARQRRERTTTEG